MQTKVWNFDTNISQESFDTSLNEIKSMYQNGALIAIPTETVYGLGANACDEKAVENIYKAKGRPSDNPLIIHIHDVKQLSHFVESVDDKVKLLMDNFWPGPISFILPLKKGYLCNKVTGGLNSIAVRMPSHQVARKVLQFVDLPIAAPSANLSGRPSPTTFEHVEHDLNGKIDGIIKSNQSDEGLESTVLDCTQYPFKIARPGAITKSMINHILPGSIDEHDYNDVEKPIAPGMKYKHYAPDTSLIIVNQLDRQISKDKDWNHTAFIFPDNFRKYIPENAKFIHLCKNENDIKGANHNLYDILHQLDKESEIEQAYIYGFEINDKSQAIMNRMLKAANNQVVNGDEL